MNDFNHTVFIDSGAHGLYAEHVIKPGRSKFKDPKKRYVWFLDPSGKKFSSEFKAYLDTYATFIKNNLHVIDLFANVDIIFSPALTWKVQRYFEDIHGIRPLPVIHHGTPMKVLERYLADDHPYIALGGLGQEVSQSAYREWADQAFNRICDQPSREPLVKVHGFALTSVPLMLRYPWYSVDSTSWLKFGSYGQVIMPPRINGEWKYDRPYIVNRLSIRPCGSANKLSMSQTNRRQEQKLFLEYIEEKGYVIGESRWENGQEIILTPGLVNDDKMRTELNALYFIDFTSALPKWPWAFYMNETKQLL